MKPEHTALGKIRIITLLIIILSGAALRFYHYSDWSLSNDELSALNRLRYAGFYEMIEEGVKKNDMHPPGVQAFLYFWTKFAGDSVAAVRLPFVLAGIFSIYIFFLLSSRWLNTNAALLCSAAMAALIFPVLYSRLARPYSPGLFFCLLAALYWTYFIFNKEKKVSSEINVRYLLGFILSGAAAMYTHYFSFMLIAIFGITGIFFLRGKKLVFYSAGGIAMILLFLPALPVLMFQMKAGGLGTWLGVPASDTFIKYIRFIFNDSLLLLLLFAIISFSGIAAATHRNRFRWLALVFFLVPFLTAYYYSIYINPVYQHSIMLFSFPFLLIFIFSFTTRRINHLQAAMLSLLLLMASGISSVWEKKFYSTHYFGVFKELAVHAVENAERYGNENITYTANVIMPYYINYYHEHLNYPIDYKIYNTSDPALIAQLNLIAASAKTSYLSYCWSNIPSPEEADMVIRQYYPRPLQVINYFNSGYRLYGKDSALKFNNAFYSFTDSFEGPAGNIMLRNDQAHSGTQSVYFSSANEFGPTLKNSAHALHYKDHAVIQVKAWVFAESIPAQASLVIQIDHLDKTIYWINAKMNDYVMAIKSWQPVFLAFRPDIALPENATVSAYVWNPGKEEFYIDDLSIIVRP